MPQHLTLTRFLRNYVYFPLGGNRKGKVRTYLNIMVVFLLSGIWHGANWTFILWGLLHGLFSCLNRIFKASWEKLHIVTRWTVNFILVNSLWVIFRSESIAHALWFLKSMFSMQGGSIDPTITEKLFTPLLFILRFIPVLGPLSYRIADFHVWFYLLLSFILVLNVKNCSRRNFKPSFRTSAVICFCLVFSILSFSGVTEFLYFNF